MRITVVIPEKPSLELNLRLQDTATTIKDQVFETYGLFPMFYKLYFNGQELDEVSKCLKDYGINTGSIIKLSHWNAVQVSKKETFQLRES